MSKKELEEIHARYALATNELAEVLSNVYKIRNRFKFISEIAHDKGGPYFILDKALVKLGVALAEANIYTNDYKEELNKQA
jgi:hypothetical protein